MAEIIEIARGILEFDGLIALALALLLFLIIIRYPGLVPALFSGRGVDEVRVGFTGVSLKLAAKEIGKAQKIWNLPHKQAPELQAKLAGFVRIPRILWVDDQIKTVQHEIRALRYVGFDVETAKSNNAARHLALKQPFDIVVSDIARGWRNKPTGLDLPDALADTEAADATVLYYVTTVSDPKTPAGDPVVNRPLELFQLVADALEAKYR